jgi:hypothetical protein
LLALCKWLGIGLALRSGACRIAKRSPQHPAGCHHHRLGGLGLGRRIDFAYVITDAQDDSLSAAGAERWRRRMRLECPVTASQWIGWGLYLVETSDCPFNGIALPE